MTGIDDAPWRLIIHRPKIDGQRPPDMLALRGTRDLCTLATCCTELNAIIAPHVRCSKCGVRPKQFTLPCKHKVCTLCVGLPCRHCAELHGLS